MKILVEKAVIEQVLEALGGYDSDFNIKHYDLITALQEALADHPVRCKGCDELFDKTCLDDDGVCASCGWPVWPAKKQAEQEPVVNQSLTTKEQKYACNPHPDAPHGFCRDESITQDRYVCECEFWDPEQAEQEPVAKVLEGGYEVLVFDRLPEETPLYAAPVRTKDLTDDEILDVIRKFGDGWQIDFARAVIAADREKNK